jgi:PHS family inorganic phosphate transporter-like MFS transporter
VPKATWKDLVGHSGQWKHSKVRFGTAWSWFAIDLAFCGLGLNSCIIFGTIDFESAWSDKTKQEDV